MAKSHYSYKKLDITPVQYSVIENSTNITAGRIILSRNRFEYLFEPDDFCDFSAEQLQEIANFLTSKDLKL